MHEQLLPNFNMKKDVIMMGIPDCSSVNLAEGCSVGCRISMAQPVGLTAAIVAPCSSLNTDFDPGAVLVGSLGAAATHPYGPG